jgi:hypothetical protein
MSFIYLMKGRSIIIIWSVEEDVLLKYNNLLETNGCKVGSSGGYSICQLWL